MTSTPNHPTADQLTRAHILLLEDDALINLFTATTIEQIGYRVSAFLEIEPAVAAARRERFDAAVLDINIAGQPRFELAALLQEQGVPMFFQTGYDMALLGQPWASMPSCRKPCFPDDLQAHLESIIRRSAN